MTHDQVLVDSLRQTDCSPTVARWGCYAWVLAMAAQLRAGEVFSRPRFELVLNEAYKRLRYDGLPIVDPADLTLNDPQAWGQLCFDSLAPQRWRLWQVGTDQGFYWPPGGVPPRWYAGPQTDDYSFLALRWGRPKGVHFTYFDPYAGIAWDPHGKLRPLSPVALGAVAYLVEVA